ncbi:MAG TPA: hypothetical protein PLH64_06775 [Anaerolineaceae bacterium]|jgi:hypothetical protein|nr:hypothetical protein [Anaerolineaceae bacterium]
MQSLNESVKEYTAQLQLGQIQKAYKGIMTFMSSMKTFLENRHTDYVVSCLYIGYMDMSYFAFTPIVLKRASLKIAIVYLHEQNRFEVWLSGANRRVQAEYINLLKDEYLGDFILSEVKPGVDSIIELKLIEKPDFDHPEKLMRSIEGKVVEFIVRIEEMFLPLV